MAGSGPRPSPASEEGSPQLLQQRLRLFQIGRVKALGEPAADGREEIAGFGVAALVATEAGAGSPRPLLSLDSCYSLDFDQEIGPRRYLWDLDYRVF